MILLSDPREARILRFDLEQVGQFWVARCREFPRIRATSNGRRGLYYRLRVKLEREFTGMIAFATGNPRAAGAQMAFALMCAHCLKREMHARGL